MIDGKKKRKRLFRQVLAVLVIIAAIGIYIWIFVFGGRTIRTETEAFVDGRISYSADSEIEEANRKIEEGCGLAEIYESDPNRGEKTVALAFYGLSDAVANDSVLRLLEEKGYRVSFLATGMEAAENEDFIQMLKEQGYELGSSGLNGETQVEKSSQAELIENFTRSRKVLTTLTDSSVNLLYCEQSLYTGEVLQAALASGYAGVVNPKKGCLLDYRSFENREDAESFVNGLEDGTLLMIRIDGRSGEISPEPVVEPDIPAKDKQAGVQVDETETKEKKVENAVELTGWILDAFEENDIKTVFISSLKPQTNENYEEEQVENADKAVVYRSFLVPGQEAALALWGLPEKTQMEEVLGLLEHYHAGATFFVTEEEAENRREELLALVEAGYTIGNGGRSESEGRDAQKLYRELLSCGRAIEAVSEEKLMAYLPVGLLPLGEIYEEDEIRRAAGAGGYVVIDPHNPEEPTAGALYGFDLSEDGASEKLEAALTQLAEAEIAICDVKQLLEDFGQMPSLTENEIEALRKANNGELSENLTYISTTEMAMSFLFYGVRNQAVITDVVKRLSAHGESGTFFVTLNEMQSCQEQIEELLSQGHEIGIAYVENSDWPENFDSVVRYLYSCLSYAQWRYGISPGVVFLPFENAEEETQEAVSALGLTLLSKGYSVVRAEHKDITVGEVPEILEGVLTSLTRGALVYFNCNYYNADSGLDEGYNGTTVCGEVVEHVLTDFVDVVAYSDPETGLIAEDSRYEVKTCQEVLDSPLCYALAENAQQDNVSPDNHVLTDMETREERFDYIASHYIGTSSADEAANLPGFSAREIRQLDKSGRITDEPVLFLTFDDWGTDVPINRLLYVLRKHNVKATFFVRANYVEYNPNLLRSIAEEGHEIASHSYAHLPLADYNEGTGRYTSLTEEELLELRADLVRSYRELYRYVGDVEVDGVPSLSALFRPPTLSVSYEGLSQVFDVGFTYSVSGDFSTHDYEAESLEQLIDTFKNGIVTGQRRLRIQNGSCIVMHMSDESKYTAQALDIMIPIWKEQGYSFARLDSYLTQDGQDGGR